MNSNRVLNLLAALLAIAALFGVVGLLAPVVSARDRGDLRMRSTDYLDVQGINCTPNLRALSNGWHVLECLGGAPSTPTVTPPSPTTVPTASPTTTPTITPSPGPSTPTPTAPAPSPTPSPPSSTPTPTVAPTSTPTPSPTSTPPSGTYTDSGCIKAVSGQVIEWVRIINCGDIGIDVDGVSNVTIRNVWLEGNGTNVRFHNSTGTLIIENSILRNPEGEPEVDHFAQQVSIDKSNGVIVRNNDLFCQRGTSSDCGQEDAIGIFESDNVQVLNNKIIGGNSESGCGILADSGTDRLIARFNEIRDHANCLIGLASGVDHFIEDNFGGEYGNVGGYTWSQYSPPCARHTWNRNNFSGSNPFWDGENCGPILGSGNSWD